MPSNEDADLDEWLESMKPSGAFKKEFVAFQKRHPNDTITTLLLALLEYYATLEDPDGLEILSELTVKFADYERTII